jgi:hypothetical protein
LFRVVPIRNHTIGGCDDLSLEIVVIFLMMNSSAIKLNNKNSAKIFRTMCDHPDHRYNDKEATGNTKPNNIIEDINSVCLTLSVLLFNFKMTNRAN